MDELQAAVQAADGIQAVRDILVAKIVNPLLALHVIAPVLLIEQSPDITTGLKFVPSATNTAPDVFVVIYKSSPLTVKSPLSVTCPC